MSNDLVVSIGIVITAIGALLAIKALRNTTWDDLRVYLLVGARIFGLFTLGGVVYVLYGFWDTAWWQAVVTWLVTPLYSL